MRLFSSVSPIIAPTLAGALLLLMFLLGCFKQRDADIWWHLKTGQLILERREIPRTDWYTFTSQDRPWIDLHWLFQVGAARLHAMGGMELLTATSALLGMAALAIQLIRPASTPLTLVVGCWYPFLFLLSGRLYVRPEVVTLLCLSCFLAVLGRADQYPKWLFFLIPIQLLWVNVQGLFILGLVLAGMYWSDGLWRSFRRTRDARLRDRTMLVAGLTAVSLVNPYGIRGLLFPLELFSKMSSEFYGKHIAELQSVKQFVAESGTIHFYVVVHFMLLGFLSVSFLLVWSVGRFDLFRALTALVFGWLGMLATRNSGQFALVAGAVTAWNIGDWYSERRSVEESGTSRTWGEAGGTVRNVSEVSPQANSFLLPFQLTMLGIMVGTIGLVATGTFYQVVGEGRLFGLGEHPLWHAHDAARFAARPGMPARMLAFHLGQAATFEFHKRDEQKTFCDPRLEVISRQLLEEYHRIEIAMKEYRRIENGIRLDQPDWRHMLARHDLRMLLLDHRGAHGAETTLLLDADWRCVYFDAIASVFLRSDTALKGAIPPVNFAQRHFETARSPSRPVTQIGRELSSNADVHALQAEVFYNIARGLLDRPSTDLSIARTLSLLSFDHARMSLTNERQFAADHRLMGLSSILLSSGGLATPDMLRISADWDAMRMLDAARARYYLTRALKDDPEDFPTLSALFSLAGLQNDRVEQYECAVAIVDGRARTKQEQIFQQAVGGKLETIERNLRGGQSITERRDSIESLQILIGELLKVGRPDLAIEECNKSSRDGRFPARMAHMYASLLMQTGEFTAARNLWEQARGADPALYLEHIASSYLAAGHYEYAIETYQAALNERPSPTAHWGLARCYLETGDADALQNQCDTLQALDTAGPYLDREIEWMQELLRQMP